MATAQNAVAAAVTPRRCRSKIQELPKHAENLNPNVLQQQQSPGRRKPLIPNSSSSASSISPSSPSPSSSSSPVVSKSCSVTASKSQKPKNPVIPISTFTPRTKIRQRKFVVAKKTKKEEEEQEKEKERSAGETTSFCKCKEKKGSGGGIRGKCLCVAYHNLRKSQEEFFKNRCDGDDDGGDEDEEIECVVETEEMGNGGLGETECGGLAMKRTRERLVKEAMEKESGPPSGSGKVKNLVQAFEKLLLAGPISKDEEEDQKEEEEEKKEPQQNDHKVMKWPPTNLTLTSQNLGLDPRDSVSSSWDSGRGSLSRRTSNGGRSSRRNSLESSSTFGGRRWKKKQQKITNPRPFKLRTEQRGMLKEEEFVKKVQEMMTEEEKQRVPVAQGLPWTTDEPECLVKPPVKEITIPVDLKLHSDVRAVDRAEFDNQVAEKLSLMEQYKLEKERQQKLEEEEEIRRLRRELVPKAQPMPYFDRPFIPRRSMKNPTMPRTPKFHKKIKCSSASWSDMSTYSFLN